MSRKVFFILGVVLCLASSPAQALDAIATPILFSAPNFRDLAGISASQGGSGFVNATSSFGVMRTGVFYRTDSLDYLSRADSATIISLRMGRDIDLRTPSEINGAPDRTPQGVLYTNINIYGTPGPAPAPRVTYSPSVAIEYMRAGYRAFVTDPLQRTGLRTVLLTLAHDSFPVMYHCSGGKDRTGWTSAILQSIAGIPLETIKNDYLATNTYTAGLIAATRAALLAQVPGANAATIDALLGVQDGYLQAGLDQVAASYGSMYAYITQGLGLSLADVYVLRAKMVYYTMLPGQSGFSGNAASGASFLRALQDSPLSGSYTAYNYYLQSAVDAGALGGIQAKAGGQAHADAAAFLARQPRRIDAAAKPFSGGQGLAKGQTRMWMAGIGGRFESNGQNGIARSKEASAGSLLGATHRIGGRASLSAGLGYNWGSVKSSDATVTTNTLLATLGGRCGFSSLESGLFLEVRADAGWVKYQSDRELGGGLGNATGKTDGLVYSGQASVGNLVKRAPFSFTPRAGVRLTGLSLRSFDESGSDLALNVHAMEMTFTSLFVEFLASLDSRRVGGWNLTPALNIAYERMLDNPQIESTGGLYGFLVSQKSAYDSRNLTTLGLSLAAGQGALTIRGLIDGVIGDAANFAGFSGQLSIAYNF